MIDLDKTKTNWYDRERIGTILFLASFLVKARLKWEGDGRTEFKISRDIIDLFISLLLCYKPNFWQTIRLFSRALLCVARTRILLAVFFFLSNSIHFPGEMSKRHLVEGSDWWNNRMFLRRRYDHPWAETKNKRTSRNTEKIDSWQNPWRPDGLWQQVTTTTAVHSNLTNVHSTSVFINIKHLYRGLP